MPARFLPKQPGLNTLAHDGWHSDAVQGGFQMVPRFGSRTVEVQTDDNAEYRVTGGTGTVWIAGEAQGLREVANNDVVLARTPGVPQSIAIFGKRSAFTRLYLLDSNGKYVDSLAVSVKTRVNKTYRMWILSDLLNTSVRTPAQVRAAMQRTETLMLAQANVQLTAVGGEATPISVPLDFGNPIKYPVNLMIELALRIKVQPGPTADYDVVSTWDIEHNVGISAPLINVALVEDYIAGLEVEEASTFAHELCHTMGAWLHEDEPRLLMSASGPGVQMSRRVINIVNDTGRFA